MNTYGKVVTIIVRLLSLFVIWDSAMKAITLSVASQNATRVDSLNEFSVVAFIGEIVISLVIYLLAEPIGRVLSRGLDTASGASSIVMTSTPPNDVTSFSSTRIHKNLFYAVSVLVVCQLAAVLYLFSQGGDAINKRRITTQELVIVSDGGDTRILLSTRQKSSGLPEFVMSGGSDGPSIHFDISGPFSKMSVSGGQASSFDVFSGPNAVNVMLNAKGTTRSLWLQTAAANYPDSGPNIRIMDSARPGDDIIDQELWSTRFIDDRSASSDTPAIAPPDTTARVSQKVK